MEGITDLNKVLLVGRLTHSPELGYTSKGTPVTRFNLAVNTKLKKKNSALFIDVVVWGKTAEFCAQYFKKGKGIYVEGYLSMNKWKTSDGSTRTKIEVIGEKIDFLSLLGDPDKQKNEQLSEELKQDFSETEKSGDKEIPFF